MMVTMIVSESP
jgi:hypothetical protein